MARQSGYQTRGQVYAAIREELMECLPGLEEGEIQPSSTLQGDLGAESIDFLDMVFRFERRFTIKIPRGELFPESIFQGDPEMVQNGRVTKEGLVQLRRTMPYADLTAFEKDPEVACISDLFTVDMLTRFVCRKLGIA
ncbi:MAG: acyl carrier protein [Parcubacteria group bacterium Gr01-1014_106]|nr:MAG: acyl carrier protein [Parcubacteria group bacterium Gr01-1014_106]